VCVAMCLPILGTYGAHYLRSYTEECAWHVATMDHMEHAWCVGMCLPILGTCGVHYFGSYTFLFLDIFACIEPSLIL
jgi:hypothetical protein